ncbi:2-hydroxyacid dehydrogenase, partial [Acidobacteriota bacterium]
ELIEKIKDKDALLSLLTDKIDEEVLRSAPNLKIVANYAVGFDNIDVQAATARNIFITNTPGVLTETVAEHTFALLMTATRRIVEADKFIRAGKFKAWGPLMLLGQDLKGKTLGVLGLGRIGAAVAQRALAMGMNVIYSDIQRVEPFEKKYNAEFADKETLLRTSDFISIHVPLMPETKHFISFREFDLMKKNAVLVNTSRGPVVDEKALLDALEKKKIAGAALDVFECEPDITCDTCSALQLKDFDSVVLTPHIASASVETRGRMAEMAAQSIVDFAGGGIPENVVNKELIKENKNQ